MTHRVRFSKKFLSVPAVISSSKVNEPATLEKRNAASPSSHQQDGAKVQRSRNPSQNSRKHLKPPVPLEVAQKPLPPSSSSRKPAIVIPKKLIQFTGQAGDVQLLDQDANV